MHSEALAAFQSVMMVEMSVKVGFGAVLPWAGEQGESEVEKGGGINLFARGWFRADG